MRKRRSGFAFINPTPLPPISWVLVIFVFLVIASAVMQALRPVDIKKAAPPHAKPDSR